MLTPQERKRLRLILAMRSTFNEETRCCIWTGGIRASGEGYGVLYFRGRSDRAHRVLVMLKGGALPLKGQVVRHVCGNDRCVNPEHLVVGTYSENNKDAYAHGRRRKPSVLTAKAQQAISDLVQEGMSLRGIVSRLLLPRTTVRDYVRKQRLLWRAGGGAIQEGK